MTGNVYRRDGDGIVVLAFGEVEHEFDPLEALALASGLQDCASMARLDTPGKTYDHDPRPSEDDERRCRDCNEDITWKGPSMYDYLHVDDEENR